MGDYGIRIRNGRSIQVDSTYKNLALRSSGSVGTTSGAGVAGWSLARFSAPISAGFVAWRCNRPAWLLSSLPQGDTYLHTFRVYTEVEGAGTLYFYIFDEPRYGQMAANQHYGLRVRNAQGEVTFDSRMKYMRGLGQISGRHADLPVYQYTGGGFKDFYFGSAVPAVLQANLAIRIDHQPTGPGPNPGWMSITASSCVKQEAGYLRLASCASVVGPSSTQPTDPNFDRDTWTYFVVDVSGF